MCVELSDAKINKYDVCQKKKWQCVISRWQAHKQETGKYVVVIVDCEEVSLFVSEKHRHFLFKIPMKNEQWANSCTEANRTRLDDNQERGGLDKVEKASRVNC